MPNTRFSDHHIKTPVVFFIFKRPEQTFRVFQAIRQAKPARLYLVADGPRNDAENLVCRATRAIVENIDWACEVKQDFSETNLGVRNRIISGLDWVFEQEEHAIILEDDCLPHPSFFRYCEELLSYYNDDQRVMHISGDNFLQGRQASAESYYFSKYAHIWGWATWRRAWSLYHTWDTYSPELDFRIFKTRSEREMWAGLLAEMRSQRMSYTWDYQWALVCITYKALCIMPKSNLVSNIGFGQDATHTKQVSWYANLPLASIEFPLMHPPKKQWNIKADQITAKYFFNATDFRSVVKSLLFRAAKSIFKSN